MRTDEESVISYLIKARNEKGLSQQKIAESIGKHKKTIQNWESGIGSPSIGDLFAWIHALDENEMKYMLLYKYGEKALDPVDDIDQKRERLHEFIDSFLTEPEIDILYYLFSGMHGSSLYAYLQKVCADLSSPMQSRYITGNIIRQHYDLAEITGTLSPSAPPIDKEVYDSALRSSMIAAINGSSGYNHF